MLKIKDDVDLKVLKKFGFRSIRSGFEWVKGSSSNVMYSIGINRIINIGTPLPVLEQLEYSDVSRYDYEFIFRPEAIVPIQIKTQTGEE